MPPKPLPVDRLLDAALTVFLRCGFGGSSMDAIAAEAGTARRTLFNRFDTKEDLFGAAIERFWTRMPIAARLPAGAGHESPTKGLLRLATSIVDFWTEPDAVALARLVIAEAERFPHIAEMYLERGKLPALHEMIAYLRELNARGVMTIPDPDLAARQFVGMLNEPLLWFRVLGADDRHSPERRRYVVAEAVRVFVAAYSIVGGDSHDGGWENGIDPADRPVRDVGSGRISGDG